MRLIGFGKSVTAKFAAALAGWFGSPETPDLLHLATRAEHSNVKWHKPCDGQAPTLTVIATEVDGAQCIYGAYRAVPWADDRKDVPDPSGKT